MINNIEQLFTALSTLGKPVFYKKAEFNAVVENEYIVYHIINEPTRLNADGATCWRVQTIQVNLITKDKNLALETQLEELLDNNYIIFDVVSETYDSNEHLHLRIYEFELDKFKED